MYTLELLHAAVNDRPVMQVQTRKRRQIEMKAAVPQNKWSRLPASLLALAASWSGDSRSLSSLESLCTLWHGAAQAKFNELWKSAYLLEWESISADDPNVAVDGAETSWKKRFTARAHIVATG